MESLTWFLTFAVLTVWAVVGAELLRRPPSLPEGWSQTRLRWLWGGVWIAALAGGVWGPTLWSHTTADHARTPAVGPPAERTSTILRTPFAVRTVQTDRDGSGQMIRTEERTAMQLPVVMLLFLGGVWYLRGRERRRARDPELRTAGTALILVLLMSPGVLAGCLGDIDGAQEPRPDRQIEPASWDTLAFVEMAAEDTLLFSTNDMMASSRGLWVLDRIGSRVAHFDWDGELQWYAGRAGGGPGELLNPRTLAVDTHDRVWVLDMGNHRITGFGPDGRMVEEVSLQNLDAVIHTMAVNASGDRFFGMTLGDRLQPVAVDLDGRVETGPRIRLRDAGAASSLAFQGYGRGAGLDDQWVYAFSTGDGLFRLDGVEVLGERVRYPEWVPFPETHVQRQEDGERVGTITRLAEPSFSAGDVVVADGRILVRFRGEGDDAGRLVDIYDLASGDYLHSVRLPRPARMTAWEDRMVLAWNDPAPRLLFLEGGR